MTSNGQGVQTYRVVLEGRIRPTSGVLDDEVREALNLAMAEMYKLGTTDPSIELDFSSGALSISCLVEVEDYERAVPTASGEIRPSLHAAEIGTPGWPDARSPRWTVEIISTRSDTLALAV